MWMLVVYVSKLQSSSFDIQLPQEPGLQLAKAFGVSVTEIF